MLSTQFFPEKLNIPADKLAGFEYVLDLIASGKINRFIVKGGTLSLEQTKDADCLHIKLYAKRSLTSK